MQIHDYKMFVNLSFFGLIKECLLGLGKPCSVVFCISNFSSDPWYVGIYTYTSTWSVQGQKCLKLWVKSDIHINEWNQICTCTCLGSLKITETLKSLVRFRITLMLLLYRLKLYERIYVICQSFHICNNSTSHFNIFLHILILGVQMTGGSNYSTI